MMGRALAKSDLSMVPPEKNEIGFRTKRRENYTKLLTREILT